MQYFTILGLFSLLSIVHFNTAKQLPAFIKKCKKDVSVDELEKCIIAAATTVLPLLGKEGIPELRLPASEPTFVPKIGVNANNLDIGWTDLNFYGIKDAEIKKVKLNFAEKYFEVHIRIPLLRVIGNYHIKGQFLLFKLDTNGPGEGNVSDFNTDTIKKFEIKNVNGKDFIKLEDSTQIKFNYTKVNIKVENIIPGNEQLSSEVTKLLNENFDEFSKDILPLLMETLTNMAEDRFIKPVFEDYSIDELFD